MAGFDENFSVDDILEELKGRKKENSLSVTKTDADRLIDEILKEKSGSSVPKDTFAAVDKKSFQVAIPDKKIESETMQQNSVLVSQAASAKQADEEKLPPMMQKMEKKFPSPMSEKSHEDMEFSEQTYHSVENNNSAETNAYLEFRENRKKKIKDFVLLGEEEEVDEQEAQVDEEVDEDKVVDEFDSMEDAPSVLADLKELTTSLSIRFGILLLLFVLNLYPVLANTFSFLPLPEMLKISETPVFYVLMSLLLLVVAVIASHTTVLGGLWNFCRLKADGDSLPALAVLASLAECVVFLLFPSALAIEGVHLYSFVALSGLLFNCMGKLLIVKRTMLNFKYITSSCDKYATTIIDDEHLAGDLTKGVLTNLPVTATNKKTGFLTRFLDLSFREDIYDALCRRLAPIVFLAVMILAVSGYMVTKDPYITLTAVAGAFAVCSSAFGLFVVNLPVLKAVKTVHKHGGMIIGYPAAEEFCDVNSATAQGSDLFPAGSVILHGIKTFKGMRIDDAILDAASILVKSKSILSDIFMQVIQGKPELLKEVDSIIYEDMMGITGWVDNKRVLIGNRDLMLNHGIDVPSKDYEKRYCSDNHEVVYLSTSGELTAVFIVSLKATADVAESLQRLESNDIFLIVKTVDPILTKEKLADVFGVEEALFRVIPSRLHKVFDDCHNEVQQTESFLSNNGKFYSYIRTLTAARRLKTRIMLGLVVLLASVIIGFGMITTLCLLNGTARLSVLFLTAYQVLWFAISWLVQRLRTL